MQLPGWQCSQAAQAVALRAAISSLAACFSDVTEVQDIANEAVPCCLTVPILTDIFNREVNAVLCFLGAGGDCTRPWACDLLTINTTEITGSLDLWDPFAKGFYLPDVTTISGRLTTTPSGVYDDHGGNMPFLTQIYAPILTEIDGYVYISYLEQLLSISLPELVTVQGDFKIGSNPNVTTINLPKITSVDGDFITAGTLALTQVYPLLTTVGGDFISVGGADLQMPSLTTFDGDFECQGAQLTQDSVNNILIVLDSQCVLTNRAVRLDGGTSAAPSGAGITAKNNLIGRGCSVSTN